MTAASLFDDDAARAARDEAIQQVDTHADTYWKTAALDAVRWVAERRPEFTTDAVWWVLDRRKVGPPREERALGAVMRQAQRDGLITATDGWVQSTRPACHARPVRVWQSLTQEAAP